MTRNLISSAAASAALLTLSACGSGDSKAEHNNAAAQVAQVTELPPAIQASRTYRCADNSLVYVDFYTNNTARVRTEQGGTGTTLTAEAGNPPFVAEGYSVAANADTTQIATPGRTAQSCRSGPA